MKKKTLILLVIITLLGGILRMIFLERYPPGVTADEIQQGYTAYSLLKTGHDEWGDLLPINPRGFGDYKPPLLSYLLVPFEAIGGLNITTLRLSSAIFGTLLIIIVYLISQEIFESENIGLLTGLILAIQPWHIQYSRLTWESNIGTTFLALAFLLFIKSFKKPRLLPLSTLIWSISLFSYHSFKVFGVLLALLLVFIYRHKLAGFNRRILVLSLALVIVTGAILAYGFFYAGASRRALDAAIYATDNINGLRDIQVKDLLPQPWGRVINNRIGFIFSVFLQNYLGYFSTTFLFSPFRSDSTLFNIPGQGLLYIWQVVPLLVGLYALVRRKIQWVGILIGWLLLAPIPAALTKEYMHAQRVETLMPAIFLVSAFGLAVIAEKLKTWFPKKVLLLGFLAVCLISLVGRIDQYLYHEFTPNLGGMKYGYKEVINYVTLHQDEYSKVFFTKSHSEPQIFVAFYQQIDPEVYQKSSKSWVHFESDGIKYLDMTDYSLGKYYFQNIDWTTISKENNILVVGTGEEIPDSVKADYEYTYQGQIQWRVVGLKK